MSASPGWYPDPEHPAVLRWWDGIRWSGETRPAEDFRGAVAAGEAPGDPVPGDPVPGAVAQDRAAGGPEAPVTQASWRTPAIEAWEARAAVPATPGRRFPRWALIVLMALIAAGIVAWLVLGNAR